MNDLQDALSAMVQQRLASGEWRAIAVAGDQALEPIADFLEKNFDIDTTRGFVAILVERQPKAAVA